MPGLVLAAQGAQLLGGELVGTPRALLLTALPGHVPRQPGHVGDVRVDVAGLVALHHRKANWIKDRPTWRNHQSVESNGTLPDGRVFASIADMRKLLANDPAQLAYGVGSHLVTYATGTRPVGVDTLAIEKIAEQAKSDAYGFRSLIHSVVQSDLFRTK